MKDFMEKARAGWGEPPDWIIALAEECNRTSQSGAARRIGYSPSAVSGLLNNTYAGDRASLEARVRARVMRELVQCPQKGELTKEACEEWRERAKNFSSHNLERVLMARACRQCPNFKGDPDGSA